MKASNPEVVDFSNPPAAEATYPAVEASNLVVEARDLPAVKPVIFSSRGK